jgi:hypothetical protein
MQSFKDFILSTFSDERGSISHKRIIASIGALALFGTYLFSRDSHLADLVFYLVCACMGLASLDKFSIK